MELTWDHTPLLSLFGFTLRYYGVLFFMTFIGAWFLLRWQVLRAGGPERDVDIFLFIGIAATWIGGRFVHMFFYEFAAFSADPSIFFQFRRGGMASHGSAIALVLAMWAFTRWRGLSAIEGCDRLTFSVALGTILVRIGNFMNSEIVGIKTDQTWGVRFPRFDHIDPAPLRHPSQLYEVVLGLIVMATLVLVDRAAGKEKRPRGLLISTMLIVYFSGRIGVEFFKEHQTAAALGVMTMGQMLSIIPLLIGVVGLIISLRKRIPSRWS